MTSFGRNPRVTQISSKSTQTKKKHTKYKKNKQKKAKYTISINKGDRIWACEGSADYFKFKY